MGNVVLTRPLTGSGTTDNTISGISIPPLATVVVDSLPANTINAGAKWTYVVSDSTNQTVLTADISANHNFDNTVRWTRFGVVGDMVPHSVAVDLVGNPSSMQLSITNNNPSTTYTASVVRTQLPAG